MDTERVFLCFSSKDRYEIVESIHYHLANIGIPTWYDRKEILMGDNRNYKNFTEGVCGCKYAIIILSLNAINSVCANEEIDLIYTRYQLQQMFVFPVFYNITAIELPEKYWWMKKLVYKELRKDTDSRGMCNHVICKYLSDRLQKYDLKSIPDLCNALTGYLKELLINYQELDGNNFNARISILYAGILFLNNQKELPEYCRKGTTYLFNETKLNLPLDLRETIIFEHLFSLAVNYFLS